MIPLQAVLAPENQGEVCGVLAGADLGDLGVAGVLVGHGVATGVPKGGVDGVLMWPSGDEEGVGHGTGEGETAPASRILGSTFLHRVSF